MAVVKKFIGWLIFISLVVILGWWGGRGFVSKDIRSSKPARMLDKAVDIPLRQVYKGIHEMWPERHTKNMISIPAFEVIESFKERSFKHNKVMLIYAYNTGCKDCYSDISNINKIAKTFEPIDLYIMAIETGGNRKKLSSILGKLYTSIEFDIYVLGTDEDKKLAQHLSNLDQTFGGFPYIGLVQKDNKIINIPTGTNINELKKQIKAAIKEKK